MLAFAGSKVTPATYPDLGAASGQKVTDVALTAALFLTMNPSLLPAKTILGFEGATAIALIKPKPASGKAELAWVQVAAPSVVRHNTFPPVHSRCEFDESIVNGAMKRKPPSVIPAVAAAQCAPPSVDFWIERPVNSP